MRVNGRNTCLGFVFSSVSNEIESLRFVFNVLTLACIGGHAQLIFEVVISIEMDLMSKSGIKQGLKERIKLYF